MAAARLGGGAAWPDRGKGGPAERGRPRGGAVGAQGGTGRRGGAHGAHGGGAAAQAAAGLGGGGVGRCDGQRGRVDSTRAVVWRGAA